ncbi:MAG: T9SS type A sorting domain-containing protein, partial [Ignavibacteriales bacterium]
VFDVLGNEVATLVNEEKSAGTYEVEFNISNLQNGISAKGGYASGVYFYTLNAGSFTQTKKLVVMK